MESKHTKKEWTLLDMRPTSPVIYIETNINKNTYTICEVHTLGDMDNEANAKLIASAPELLAEMVNFCDSAIIDKKIAENQLAYFRTRFLAAINKATL